MYHYRECGLNDVWLRNGYSFKQTPYGDALLVTDAKGLHRVIAERLVFHKPSLTGPEFRFLRKELDMSQQSLAFLMGKDVQSVARWEKQGRVPKMAERMLRMIYRDCTDGDQASGGLKELVDRLNEIDLQAFEKMKFEHSPHRWKAAA